MAALGGVVAAPPREDEGAHPAAPVAAPSTGAANMTSVATRQRHAGEALLGCLLDTQSRLPVSAGPALEATAASRCERNVKNPANLLTNACSRMRLRRAAGPATTGKSSSVSKGTAAADVTAASGEDSFEDELEGLLAGSDDDAESKPAVKPKVGALKMIRVMGKTHSSWRVYWRAAMKMPSRSPPSSPSYVSVERPSA